MLENIANAVAGVLLWLMEAAQDGLLWAADKIAQAYRWIGMQVIPGWNRLAAESDEILMLASLLVLALGIGLLFVHDPYWKRHPDKKWAWMEKDDLDWFIFYRFAIKVFYYPMLIYIFMMLSPFTSFSTIQPEATFFLRFREQMEAYQLVLALLLLRFVGVSIGYVVRLRVFGLFRFWVHTLCCIILGTYLQGILRFLGEVGQDNILLLIPILILDFIVIVVPMIYFWIAMLMPLYVLVMPILSIPIAIVGGVINAMQKEHDSFIDWVKEKHIFAYALFFVWD